ncbi:MAG TPA: hypothetical protein VFV49_15260 [Thermoanaerobaculia bacterium]|nr:hypothetical protein [Thermoanaerobaculia bacterium]
MKMMGDTSVETVNKHYFNIELDLMQEMVLGWERPDVPVPSSASLTVFGAEQTPICDAPLGVCAVENFDALRFDMRRDFFDLRLRFLACVEDRVATLVGRHACAETPQPRHF